MVAEEAILTIPRNVIILINAFGGILALYLVFGVINSIVAIRRNKKINKMIDATHKLGRDVEDIKKLLVKKL